MCVPLRARTRVRVCELYQSIYKAFRVLDWIPLYPGYFFDIAVRRFPSVTEVSCSPDCLLMDVQVSKGFCLASSYTPRLFSHRPIKPP